MNETDGVIMLSERAGAHAELGSAVIGVNPFDIEEQAEALYDALTMPRDLRRRLVVVADIVRNNNMQKWLRHQLHDIRSPAPTAPAERHSDPSPADCWQDCGAGHLFRGELFGGKSGAGRLRRGELFGGNSGAGRLFHGELFGGNSGGVAGPTKSANGRTRAGRRPGGSRCGPGSGAPAWSRPARPSPRPTADHGDARREPRRDGNRPSRRRDRRANGAALGPGDGT